MQSQSYINNEKDSFNLRNKYFYSFNPCAVNEIWSHLMEEEDSLIEFLSLNRMAKKDKQSNIKDQNNL